MWILDSSIAPMNVIDSIKQALELKKDTMLLKFTWEATALRQRGVELRPLLRSRPFTAAWTSRLRTRARPQQRTRNARPNLASIASLPREYLHHSSCFSAAQAEFLHHCGGLDAESFGSSREQGPLQFSNGLGCSWQMHPSTKSEYQRRWFRCFGYSSAVGF